MIALFIIIGLHIVLAIFFSYRLIEYIGFIKGSYWQNLILIWMLPILGIYKVEKAISEIEFVEKVKPFDYKKESDKFDIDDLDFEPWD